MARIKQVAGDEVDRDGPDHGDARDPPLPRPRRGRTPPGADHRRPAEERAKTGDFAEFLVDDDGQTIPPSFEVPTQSSSRPTPARCSATSSRIRQRVRQALPGGAEEGDGRAGPDAGAIIGYALATFHQQGAERHLHRPARHEVGLVFPRFGKTKSEAGLRHVHGRRLLQERHERVRLDPRLRPARAAPEDAVPATTSTGNVGAVNQIQIKVRPGVDLRRSREKIQGALDKLRPMFFRVRPGSRSRGRSWRRSRSSRAS